MCVMSCVSQVECRMLSDTLHDRGVGCENTWKHGGVCHVMCIAGVWHVWSRCVACMIYTARWMNKSSVNPKSTSNLSRKPCTVPIKKIYIYIYIYIHIYMYIYTYMYVCLYIYVHLHRYMNINICINRYLHMSIYRQMDVCIYANIYIQIYRHVHVWIYTYIDT